MPGEKRPQGRPRKRPLGPTLKARRGRPPIYKTTAGLLGLCSAPRDYYLLLELAMIERAQAGARAQGRRLSFRSALRQTIRFEQLDILEYLADPDPDIERLVALALRVRTVILGLIGHYLLKNGQRLLCSSL